MREKRFSFRFKGLFWEERLIWICLFILMSQWVDALVPYWYEETISMTDRMLSVMLFLGLLIPAVPHIRIPIGVALVFWSVFRELSDIGLWIAPDAEHVTWLERMSLYHPYIWLVGLIWLTYEIFMRAVNTGGHILLLMIIQLIVFGILDSFTPVNLWVQVAWIMAASLLWLIALHFRNVRLQYPAKWKRSKRYALQMIVSAVVLVSLIITTGVSVPGLEPVLTDPYTSWIESGKLGAGPGGNGQGHGGTGSLSGYSMNDKGLGGGFEMNFMPVMTVQSDYRGYWRGETKSTYLGDGWADYNKMNLTEHVLPDTPVKDGYLRAPDVPTRMVKQSFTMLDDKVYPVLFGMASISSYEQLDVTNEGELLWNVRDDELKYLDNGTRKYPKTYTIISNVLEATPDQMREATQTRKESYESMEWQQYLQLPNFVPDRVKELAVQLTENATNDYDRAMFIETYLRTHFTYTNKPDISKRKSPDFVDSFLFEVQEGYCDYYSSAMAVMMRSIGVPTRWVKGYAPGSRDDIADGLKPQDLLERMADPNAGGTFRVTNADAHSWVEVYLGDYGWVAFEPTPGFSMPRLEPQAEPSAIQNPQELSPDNTAAPLDEEKSLSLPSWVGLAAQIVLALAVLLVLAYLLKRWQAVGFSLRWLRLISRSLSPNQRMIVETELWLSYCRWRGLQRTQDETVREAIERWYHDDSDKRNAANSIVRQFEQAKYGAETMSDQDCSQLKVMIRNFKREMK
ncbi:DUF4129 domain-containing transglutaminase family protein [Paenibacillus marinisediminis]